MNNSTDIDKLEEEIIKSLMAEVESVELVEDEAELFNEASDLDVELDKSNKKKKAIDTKIVKCKECDIVEEWVSTGHFPNGTKKWRDEDSLICNGRICGKCNAKRSKSTMKKTRAVRDEYYDNL